MKPALFRPRPLVCLGPVLWVFFSYVSHAQFVDADTAIQVVEGSQGLASGDLDGDGLTTPVDVFLLSLGWRNEITELISSSPLKNEADVAITRETILQFSGPLDPTTVNPQSISATFAGNPLGTRLNVSPDRTRVTVFYADPLPASARIRVSVDGSRLRNAAGLLVDADRDRFPGGVETIDFDTLTLTTLPGTSVYGRVFATELATPKGTTESVNVPLKGVRITVDGREGVLFTETDSLGNFRLDPAPAGGFFVHVDGRTVTEALIDGVTVTTTFPNGHYYPYVGKKWVSIPGRETNVGTLYLPLVIPGTLHPVSATQDTAIGFADEVLAQHPEFAGAQVIVPPDSLYSDDGTRGGMVGIAPVPPDRMPGTLPSFMMPGILISVQTDGGTNFDTPLPVCLPNIADPFTGILPSPGETRELFSFNHDIGDFEPVGSMTVSQDGALVCTDPGVGIPAPGWHFFAPPPDDPPPPCPGGGPDNKTPNDGKKVRGDSNAKVSGPNILSNDEDFFEWYRRDIKIGHELLLARLLNRAVLKEAASEAGSKLGGFFVIPEAGGAILLKIFACNPEVKPPPKQSKSLENGESKKGMSGPAKALLSDPLLDQLDAIFLEMVQVLYPYELDRLATGSEEPVPQEAVDQVYDLLDQANQLVGGDAQAFLESKKIELEQALRSSRYYDTGGMAVAEPPLPVYYIASILRQNDNLILRGKTRPLAQYEVFIPADGTLLQLVFYDPAKKALGAIVPNENPDRDHALPRSARFTQEELTNPGIYEHADTDGDNLPDIVEWVIGTETDESDTDGDGIDDGAELDQGTDPLDGLPTATGIIATADTPGNAVDIATSDNLVVLADSSSGISVFNVFNGMNPVIVAQVDTPGTAERVTLSGSRAAVADGPSGLAVVNLSDPPSAAIEFQLNLKGNVRAVAMAGDTAYAGLTNGDVVWVDLLLKQEAGRVRLPEAVRDLAVSGDRLYALSGTTLYALNRFAESMPPVGSAVSPVVTTPNERLFVGGNLAYAVHGKGYNTFTLSNPDNPLLLASSNNPEFGWRHIVENGAGLGFAAVNPNFAFDGPNDVSLYDVSSPTSTNVFLNQFATPGIALAVSIYNGLGYVADGQSGMQVVNYISFDNQRVPPVILEFDSPDEVEEGATYRLTVQATDDVQVRNAEFFVDGARVATDGNFPFEVYLPAPQLADQTEFVVQARVSDTGGSFVLSVTSTVSVTEDRTPPRIRSVTPQRASLVGAVQSVSALFSEPLDPASIDSSGFLLFEIGPDLLAGTFDDIPILGGTLSHSPDVLQVTLTYDAALDPGNYLISIPSLVTDVQGNVLSPSFTSSFRSFDFTDSDLDGIPDELEAALGFEVGNPDTDGDGIPDGDEDNDSDGVPTSYEILVLMTDPADSDSDGDGVTDGNEDFDGDSLINSMELLFGTDPFQADTDNDGWNDETETTAGSNPLDPNSIPLLQEIARPQIQISIPSTQGLLSNVVIPAYPTINLSLLSSTSDLFTGTIPAYPPVQVSVPGTTQDSFSPTIVAKPPVDIEISGQP